MDITSIIKAVLTTGEERPKGLVGRILAPQGGEVFHWDRFLLPGIAQVEYRLGEHSHIITTAALTPRSRNVTDLFATVAVNVPVPNLFLWVMSSTMTAAWPPSKSATKLTPEIHWKSSNRTDHYPKSPCRIH